MALKQGLLGLLNYGEMTGYELAKVFNDSLSFFWQAQTSQIYRELNQLEAEGLLHSGLKSRTENQTSECMRSRLRAKLNWTAG